jgi:hypothetical protein
MTTNRVIPKSPAPSIDEADEIISNVASKDSAPKRPPVREDSPKERARKRAEELRAHLGNLDEGSDNFYIDPEIIPDGWSYQWKRHTIYGQEDPAYQVQLARAGWTAVPASRHPEMMPAGTADGVITRKGMILMECPSEIIEERRGIEFRQAREQVRHKEAQIAGTPDGTMTRDHARVRPSIKKGYEPMPIPE